MRWRKNHPTDGSPSQSPTAGDHRPYELRWRHDDEWFAVPTTERIDVPAWSAATIDERLRDHPDATPSQREAATQSLTIFAAMTQAGPIGAPYLAAVLQPDPAARCSRGRTPSPARGTPTGRRITTGSRPTSRPGKPSVPRVRVGFDVPAGPAVWHRRIQEVTQDDESLVIEGVAYVAGHHRTSTATSCSPPAGPKWPTAIRSPNVRTHWPRPSSRTCRSKPACERYRSRRSVPRRSSTPERPGLSDRNVAPPRPHPSRGARPGTAGRRWPSQPPRTRGRAAVGPDRRHAVDAGGPGGDGGRGAPVGQRPKGGRTAAVRRHRRGLGDPQVVLVDANGHPAVRTPLPGLDTGPVHTARRSDRDGHTATQRSRRPARGTRPADPRRRFRTAAPPPRLPGGPR